MARVRRTRVEGEDLIEHVCVLSRKLSSICYDFEQDDGGYVQSEAVMGEVRGSRHVVAYTR